MSRRNPNRRFLVTTANTAIATAAVTATAAGWAAFGLTDTGSANAAKPQHAISQPVAADKQHRADSLRRLMHKEWWQFDFFGNSRSPITRTRSSR
ncbi:MAG: hypothetical protein WCF99_18275 [Chloroflexales bacterium]